MTYADAVDEEYVPSVDYAGNWSAVLHDRCKTCKSHYVGCYCGGLEDINGAICYDPYVCLFNKELADG